MAFLTDLGDELKKIFSYKIPNPNKRAISPVPQSRGTRQYNTYLSKARNTLAKGKRINTNRRPIGQTIKKPYVNYYAGVQKQLEKTPQFKFSQRIKNPVGSFAAAIPEDIMNIPYKSVRAGRDFQPVVSGRDRSPQRIIGASASLAEPVFDVATLWGGGTVAKQGVKQVAKKGFKPVVKQAAKKAPVVGAGYGMLFGGLHGLREGMSAPTVGKQMQEGGKQAVIGGAIGGTIGALPLVGGKLTKAGYKQVQKKVAKTIEKNLPRTQKHLASKKADEFIRDELGQFLGKKKKPVQYIKDYQITDAERVALRKSLGLPLDGDYSKGFARIPGGKANDAKGSLYDIPQKKYPLADRGEWYGEANYKDNGGRMVEMTPDEFLARAKKLELDDVARDNIDDLKNHIESGRTLDPLNIYDSDLTKAGATDGRHRAVAAKELGIEKVPVIDFTKPNVAQPPIGDMSKQRPGEAGFVKIAPEPRVKMADDPVIEEARQQIGRASDKPRTSVGEFFNNLYTQVVDRYHPISRASKQVKQSLKSKNAELRPEVDPDYAVRRLTGAAGIADFRFKEELNPILKEIEASKIDPSDMDIYLANKRMAGFGEVGRDIIGADPVKAKQVVSALEAKYGQPIIDISNKLYAYQDRGLDELIKAGFISKADATKMRGQNPDYAPLYRVMDEVNDYLGIPTRKTMQSTQPIKKIKGSERQIESPLESIIGNTYSQRAVIEKNNVARSIVDLQKMLDLGFEKVGNEGYNTVKTPDGEFRKVLKPEWQQAKDVIFVWRDGKKEAWRVGDDIAEVAKGANEESMNIILKVLQQPAALLRQGATGRNPAFMIPNIVRDQLDASITSKYGYIPFVDFLSGLKSMIGNDDIYKKWQQSGAKIDLGELSGRKTLETAVGDKTAKRNLFSWLGDTLDWAGKYSEQPTRVGLFKKAYNKTGNINKAMLDSRDATVDFARMGTKMKVANSIVPFLNVKFQGFDKLIRATKNNPGATTLKLGTYAAVPAIMTTMYNLMNHPEEYAEIPEWDKSSNFILISGRNPDGTVNYKKIPKGNIVPMVANPIQSFLEYAYGQDDVSFKRMAMRTFSEALPVIGEGSTLKEIGIKTIGQNMPHAFKPATELAMNRSFWKYDDKKAEGREIVPYYLKDKPAYQQDYKFTPVMYKKIGAALNVSPLQVKHVMEGYTAGYSKMPAQIIEIMSKASRGQDITPNDIPILYRFMAQTYPSSSKTAKERAKPKTPGFFARITSGAEASEGGPLFNIFGGKKEVEAEEPQLPNETQAIGVLYEDNQRTIDGYEDQVTKIQYGDYEDWEKENKLADLEEDYQYALQQQQQIQEQYPEKIFEIEIDTYKSGGSAKVPERAEWAYQQLSTVSNEQEMEKMYQKLLDENVLTKSVVEELNEKYDLGLSEYMSGGKVKSLGGSGSKKSKSPNIRVKATSVNIPKFRISGSRGSIPRGVTFAPMAKQLPKQQSLQTNPMQNMFKIAPLTKHKIQGLTDSKRLV